jgi:hypothetical protein
MSQLPVGRGLSLYDYYELTANQVADSSIRVTLMNVVFLFPDKFPNAELKEKNLATYDEPAGRHFRPRRGHG